jgi:hypothetical protein
MQPDFCQGNKPFFPMQMKIDANPKWTQATHKTGTTPETWRYSACVW